MLYLYIFMGLYAVWSTITILRAWAQIHHIQRILCIHVLWHRYLVGGLTDIERLEATHFPLMPPITEPGIEDELGILHPTMTEEETSG